MHWSQQGMIMDPSLTSSPIIKEESYLAEDYYKTHDDIEGDICHTKALNQGLL